MTKINYFNIVIIVLISITTPLIATQANHDIVFTANQKPANSAIILFDSNDMITTKAAFAMKGLLQSYIPTSCLAITDYVTMLATILEQPENHLIIYAFHGHQTGFQIAEKEYSWKQIAKEVVIQSSANYHLFLSCESSYLPNTGKSVFTQSGACDYVVNIVNSVQYITEAIMKPDFLQNMVSSILSDQTSLFLRYQYPQETLWATLTHETINTIAWNQLLQVSWIDDAIATAGYTIASLPQANPDVEEERLDINDLPAIAEAINANSEILKNTLQHTSFTVNVDLNIVTPEFYATELNWDDDERLVEIDEADGDLDGIIIYDDITLYATSAYLDRMDFCIDQANKFLPIQTASHDYNAGSSTNYEWAAWLSRTSHYMQDQQNPFHTSLVDENDYVVDTLNIEAKYNAEERFVYHCNNVLVPEFVSRFIFQNFADNILTNNYDLEFWIGAVITAGVFYMFAPTIALQLLLGINAYTNDFNEFMDTKIVEFDNIETNCKNYNQKHESYENMVNFYIRNTPSQLVTETIQYINNNIDLIKSTAKEFVIEEKRNIYLNTWIEESYDDADDIYDELKLDDVMLTQAAEDITFERIKQAAFQTSVLFEAYFIQSIWKTDSDNDGMSDYFEEIIYNTPVTSGKHRYIMVLNSYTHYHSLGVILATTNVPCQKITVMIGHDYDSNYITKTYTSSSGQYQTISNQYFTINRVDISFIKVSIYFYEYQIGEDYNIVISVYSHSLTYELDGGGNDDPFIPPE